MGHVPLLWKFRSAAYFVSHILAYLTFCQIPNHNMLAHVAIEQAYAETLSVQFWPRDELVIVGVCCYWQIWIAGRQ